MSRKVHNAAFVKDLRKNSINILALLLAVPVLAYSLYVSTPSEYAKNAGSMLASAANMSASVPENPYNTVAAQLAQKEAQLDQREAELAARASQGPSFSEMLGVSSFFISLLLLLLVALNFYYDVQRGRLGAIPRKFQVDLR